jgi:hypothetical protein
LGTEDMIGSARVYSRQCPRLGLATGVVNDIGVSRPR